MFAWYTVETDVTRYKNTGTHVVYDAGGPADGTLSTCGGTVSGTGFPPCGPLNTPGDHRQIDPGQHRGSRFRSRTNLRYPGAVYCATADCTGKSIQNGPTSSDASEQFQLLDSDLGTGASCTAAVARVLLFPQAASIRPGLVSRAGRVSRARTTSSSSARRPYFTRVRTAGIHGHVIYASTRPFDDPMMLVQTQWEPLVPNVTINLYQEGFAIDTATGKPGSTLPTLKTRWWIRPRPAASTTSRRASGPTASETPFPT